MTGVQMEPVSTARSNRRFLYLRDLFAHFITLSAPGSDRDIRTVSSAIHQVEPDIVGGIFRRSRADFQQARRLVAPVFDGVSNDITCFPTGSISSPENRIGTS
ncbi:MAG: hypothetical protein AAGM21_10350, partial [Pseudomonadota bacterium]